MGKARIRPIEWINCKKDRRFFIDANIWIYLNGPQVKKDYKTREYSGALKKIRDSHSAIYIDVLVLSEFINRYLRIKLAEWDSRGVEATLKNFRSSSDYPAVAENIADAVRGILKVCERIDSGFASVDIDSLIGDFGAKRLDFNDQILAEICRTQDLTMITHDGHFSRCDIKVLTANKHMLEPSSQPVD
ncbi:MAG: PIN domain-containing protein [Candidatus Coatesbacteria bacterium]|nr:PIN domain-containing protein [Candidatus Coatesbacteria bacterium]